MLLQMHAHTHKFQICANIHSYAIGLIKYFFFNFWSMPLKKRTSVIKIWYYFSVMFWFILEFQTHVSSRVHLFLKREQLGRHSYPISKEYPLFYLKCNYESSKTVPCLDLTVDSQRSSNSYYLKSFTF